MNKQLILGLAAGLAVFGVGMLPALTATLTRQNDTAHARMPTDARPHAMETCSCSPSPSASPQE